MTKQDKQYLKAFGYAILISLLWKEPIGALQLGGTIFLTIGIKKLWKESS